MDIHRIALLGDKDHGKSTFIGSMLMLTKSVSDARIGEAKRMSKELGRPFEPGFILDSFSEEREDAMTIDTTRAQLRYKGFGFEFIDVPGHEELIANMLTGASSAGTAVLMVSAKKGEGISSQTKRHLLLARMLGIDRIVVAVNKMDTVGYSKAAFEAIAGPIESFISNSSKAFGGIDAEIVPISAYKGDNLISRSKSMKWYKGMLLVEAMQAYASKRTGIAKTGLRAIVQGPIGSNQVACKVLSGKISKGSTVIALPNNSRHVVERVVKAGRSVASAAAGDAPMVAMGGAQGVQRGSVLCYEDDKPLVGSSVQSIVFLVKKPTMPVLKLATQERRCRLSISRSIDIDKGTLEKAGRFVQLGIYKAIVNTGKPIAYERFSKLRELGRFTLHEGGKFVGVGIMA